MSQLINSNVVSNLPPNSVIGEHLRHIAVSEGFQKKSKTTALTALNHCYGFVEIKGPNLIEKALVRYAEDTENRPFHVSAGIEIEVEPHSI